MDASPIQSSLTHLALEMRSKKARSSETEVERLQAIIEEMAQRANMTDALEQRLQALETQCQEERTRFNTAVNMVTLYMGQINERSARQALAWQERASVLQEQVNDLEGQLEEKDTLGNYVEELEEKYQKAGSALRRAEKQLEAVQGFLETSDQYSGAEIADAVEKLNDSIYQCASMLANKTLDEALPPLSPSDEGCEPVQQLRDDALRAIGAEWSPQIVEEMLSEVRGENTSLLRNMIQHIICSWCHHIFQTLFPENPDAEDCIKAVWYGVQENCKYWHFVWVGG